MQIDQQHQQEDAHKIQMTAVLLLGCKPQRKSDTSERVYTSPDSRLLVILMLCTDPTKPFLIHNELFIPTRWITLRIDEGFEILGEFHRSDDERVKKEVRSVVSSEEEYLLGKRVFVIFI